MSSPSYAVLVPLKATTRGKSRLGLPDPQRTALAAAMARDTLASVTATPLVSRVLVVAENADDVALLTAAGAEMFVTAIGELNGAITDGAGELARRGWTGPVAVLPGDLPFLTSDDLARALQAAAGRAAVVGDAAGTGTTMLVASSPAGLNPRFGVDSYEKHLAGGASALPVETGSSLHKDVDVLSDLRFPDDLTLLGEHTRAVVADLAATGFLQVTVLP